MQPTHGRAGSKKREFCREHVLDGMVNVTAARCVHDGCSSGRRLAWRGPRSQGSAGPRWNGERYRGELRTRRVLQAGEVRHGGDQEARVLQGTRPRWNGERHRDEEVRTRRVHQAADARQGREQEEEFCREHALDGMVNVTAARCVHEGCSKIASFGRAGSKSSEFCSKHAPPLALSAGFRKAKPAASVADFQAAEVSRVATEAAEDALKAKCVALRAENRRLRTLFREKKPKECKPSDEAISPALGLVQRVAELRADNERLEWVLDPGQFGETQEGGAGAGAGAAGGGRGSKRKAGDGGAASAPPSKAPRGGGSGSRGARGRSVQEDGRRDT